jgi:adenylate kinase family enzyme
MLMGIQGSGKGTQAALINKNYGYISLETGAILRSVLENPHISTIKLYQIQFLMARWRQMLSFLTS